MEETCSPLGWAYYGHKEEGMEELKSFVLYSTLELEAAVISAHDELSRKDNEIFQLKSLIEKMIKERDEFRGKCRRLVLEKQVLFQQLQIQAHSSKQQLECELSSGTTSNQDEDTYLSPCVSDENTGNTQSQLVLDVEINEKKWCRKALPEKGNLLQAVMEAGPLLRTLLVAGQLPQWQHPPPKLSSFDIPPVRVSPSGPQIFL